MREVEIIEEDIHENYLKKFIAHVQTVHVEPAKKDIKIIIDYPAKSRSRSKAIT
jgi:hypothetical protein